MIVATFPSKLVKGVTIHFVRDGEMVGRVDLLFRPEKWGREITPKEERKLTEEATELYPQVMWDYGERIGVNFFLHPNPFGVK